MKSALLVIDVQNIYTNKKSEMFCKDSSKTIDRINNLISFFKIKKSPIYLIRHIHKADGSDLGRIFDYEGEPAEEFNFVENTFEVKYDSRLKIPKGSIEIIKNRYSSFTNTILFKSLKENKIDTVVICGFMTNFCCNATAIDAHGLDFFVDFVTDATGTPGTENYSEKEIRKIISSLLSEGFCRIANTKEYIKSMKG
jgi:nicotinamidase-related amidase